MISEIGSHTSLREWALSLAGTPEAGGRSYLDLMRGAVDEMRQRKLTEYDAFMKKEDETPRVRLTAEEKQDLRERFDPEDMSWEEYQDFVDELVRLGVFDESDKRYVGYGVPPEMGSIPIEFMTTVTIQEGQDTPLPYCFNASQGNILNWARLRAGVQGLDSRTQTWVSPRDAVLFAKMRDVLEAIA